MPTNIVTEAILNRLIDGLEREQSVLHKPLTKRTAHDKNFMAEMQKWRSYLKACGVDYEAASRAATALAHGAFS